jgi:hypothetical protein
MQERYRSYLIDARAGRTPCLDFWVPIASISWNERGVTRSHVLTGALQSCKNEEEAAVHAIATARMWIDGL